MKNLIVVLFLVLVSCTKELLHEPGVPYLQVTQVKEYSDDDNDGIIDIQVFSFEETPNIKILKFSLTAYEGNIIIPSDEIFLHAFTSTSTCNVRDVVKNFKMVVGKFEPLICSGFPVGSTISLPPVPYRIELKKDSTIEIAISITLKRIDNCREGTMVRLVIPDNLKINIFNDKGGNRVIGVYGSAWSPWLKLSR